MRIWISLACTAVLAAGLTACGGGGGGDGSPAALAVSVSINGTPATVDANGQYAVKPGDTVEVTPNRSADWSTSASTDNAITLRNPAASNTKWAAQILNSTANPVTYTVAASVSGNAALKKQAVLAVAAGDARNGQYRVYATSGAQLLLNLDFNINAYRLSNTDGSGEVSDDFTADSADAGTYIFKSSRITSVANTARFRAASDAVVGNFPFVDPFAATTGYAVKPFLAVRKFVTDPAALDGLYNRLGTEHTAAASTSNILQLAISGSGTAITMCRNSTVFSIANCPQGSESTYTVTPSDLPGIWNLVSTTNANDTGKFAMARIGDQNVFMSAGEAPTVPGQMVWRLAVQDTATWQAGTAHGGTSRSGWGTVDLTPTNYTRTALGPDGTTTPTTGQFSLLTSGPLGMRQIDDGAGNTYFGIYNTRLFVTVGASNATTGGYVQLNLID